MANATRSEDLIDTTISQVAMPLVSDGLFPHYDIGPQKLTPRLALVGDLNGNELNGMFTLLQLAGFLQSIHLGERSGLRLHQRVLIVPTIHALVTGDRGDLDADLTKIHRRMLWSTATRALLVLTHAAYYRVDIHQVSLDVEEMPQVRLYTPNDDERATACLFGLPAVIERPLEPGTGSDLVRAWRQQGGENFSIYVGQSGSLQAQHCETLFKALISFLDRTGIVSGLYPATEEDELRYFDQRQFFAVLSKQSGIFGSNLKVGQWVRAGSELGQIYDSFTGRGVMRLVAPVTGILASLRRQPLVCKGELLARILVPTQGVGTELAASGGWKWPNRRP